MAVEFEKAGRKVKVRIQGQFVFNTVGMTLKAALNGVGSAHLPKGQVQAHLDSGHLVRVLSDWCPPFAGYHLYYSTRRKSCVDGSTRRGPSSPAFPTMLQRACCQLMRLVAPGTARQTISVY